MTLSQSTEPALIGINGEPKVTECGPWKVEAQFTDRNHTYVVRSPGWSIPSPSSKVGGVAPSIEAVIYLNGSRYDPHGHKRVFSSKESFRSFLEMLRTGITPDKLPPLADGEPD